jgi:translation elongation factor EF-1beta
LTEYLVLQKLSPSKILDVIEKIRKIPESGINNIDSYYTMNIFGTWNIAVWFNAKNSNTALDFVHKKIKKVKGVTDSYIISMFPQSNGMIEYLVLLKLSPSKILEATQELRKIPEKGIEGIDTYYTISIFGAWDVGIWFKAEDAETALDFVHNTLRKVSGVQDTYVIPTFPQYESVTKLPIKSEKIENIPKTKEKVLLAAAQ